jgi:hypothetical protein
VPIEEGRELLGVPAGCRDDFGVGWGHICY